MTGDPEYFKKLFPEKHVPLILSSVLDVGSTVHRETDYDREDRISTKICGRLQWIPPFRDGPLAIHPQQEIIDGDIVVGRIEILISCGEGSHVYFAIEAKRLRFRNPKGRFETGNAPYVNDGMMRFVTGQYAPFMETGAMLGYVFDGETGKARSGVANYIRSKEKELRLREPKRLLKSKILADSLVDETLHDLGERQFTIYHLFVAV